MQIINKTFKKSSSKKSNTKNTKNTKSLVVKNEEFKLCKHDVIFDIVHLKKLLYGPNFKNDVPNYINKFFYRYGSKIFYDNGESFECLSEQEAKQKIPAEFSRQITITKGNNSKNKEIKLNSYFTHEMFLSTNDTKLTIDYSKDIKYKDTKYIRGFEQTYNILNMKKDLPRNYNKKVEMTEFNKAGVHAFFDHIKKVICSGSDEEYDVVTMFIASSIMGHKLKIALIWNSLEQSGKGTVLNCLDDLLGARMHKTSDSEKVIKYTKDFEGCTMLNFDEMPKESSNSILADKQKALITEPEFDCRAMYQQSYIQKNTFNIIITSQNNVVGLTQTNLARYYVNSISNDYIGNKEYFDTLHKYLKSEDVKILIFQEFEKIFREKVEPVNWLGTNLKPTRACKLKRMDALPKLHKYIKDNYLKAGKGINEITSIFLDDYKQIDRFATPHKVGSTLKEFGVITKKENTNSKTESSYRRYIIPFTDLRKYYSDKGWIDEEYDEIPNVDEIEEKNDEDEINPLDYGIEEVKKVKEEVNAEIFEPKKEKVVKSTKSKKSIKSKKKQIEDLSEELFDLSDELNNFI